MKAKRITTLLALMLVFGAKASAQEPEWSWRTSLAEADTAFFRADEPYELSDGTVLLSGRTVYKDDCGLYKYYFPHPELQSLSSEGTELYHRQYAKEGYFGTMPHVLESGSGEVFLFITYSPDHDTCSSNYFKNFEPVTDHCILGLYKLNDDLSIAESHELEIPIDTFEWRNEQNQLMYYRCGQIFPISAFVDDDGSIVGAYTKNVSWDYDNPRGYDSTVFFRMDLQGSLVRRASYCGNFRSGAFPDDRFCRHHIVKADSLYLYYGFEYDVISENRSNLIYLDHDFNIVRTRYFRHSNAVHPTWNDEFQYMNIIRSQRGTTYLTSSFINNDYHYSSVLYEYNDDINGNGGTAPIVRYAERKTEQFDFPTYYTCVDLSRDGSLYMAYTLHQNVSVNEDSWIVIERLTPEFDTISTLFFGELGDRKSFSAFGIKATEDGGVILVSRINNLNNNQRWNDVRKYPAEAFVGIEEAHDSGLKVAIAYPNPGKDVLNIRTGLKDARVGVYDMNGRMVYRQEITGNVTAINTTDWSEGTYVWKVYASGGGPSTGSGTLVETGKWIKE